MCMLRRCCESEADDVRADSENDVRNPEGEPYIEADKHKITHDGSFINQTRVRVRAGVKWVGANPRNFPSGT